MRYLDISNSSKMPLCHFDWSPEPKRCAWFRAEWRNPLINKKGIPPLPIRLATLAQGRSE